MEQTPRRFASPHQATPRTHLLSNGDYSVMLSTAGSGYSRWRDQAVTRWREDRTCDPWGSFVFLRDVGDGRIWSAAYQPLGEEADEYEAAFYEDRARFSRTDGPFITTTEIVVSGEHDAEVRRVSISNTARDARIVELTTYAEPVLSAPDADSAHPAFSKMFVLTEFLSESGALLATRRGREAGERQLWAAHVSVLGGESFGDGEALGPLQFETDRARFLGRGRELRDALSIRNAQPLSNTVGTVLDPVLTLRRRVRIPPGAAVHVDFWLAVATSRDAALAFVEGHREPAAFKRACASARDRAAAGLERLGVTGDEAGHFQRLANPVLYGDPAWRPSDRILSGNRLGQPALWAHGISGDLPIVLLEVDAAGQEDVARQLLRAREYWESKRLAVDLVVLDSSASSANSGLRQSLEGAAGALMADRHEDGSRRGALFVLRADSIPSADLDLLRAAARAVLRARDGSLGEQLARLADIDLPPRPRRAMHDARSAVACPAADLEFFNGLGGFAADAREYVVMLDADRWTPMPWINVIANPHFGFLATSDGCGSTWSLNAQQNQLTPWCNDPVSDTPAEVVYVRDEESGALWSPTPLPLRDPSCTYTIRHGFGFSRYEHASPDLGIELLQFVPMEDPVKISRLRIVNHGASPRRLSVTHYVDWILGNQRGRTAPHVVTEIEPTTRALLARNSWNADFQQRIAFMDMAGQQQSHSGDRTGFIGRHGSLAEPAALLGGGRLSNRVGGGLDPCGALQTVRVVQPGETLELTLLLGQEASPAAAIDLIMRYRSADLDAALGAVSSFWADTLGALQVETPDRSVDILLNGWLLYQTLVCRVWGRTAFYQSSGAYGYRDQLQDVMALLMTRPAIAREHLVRAAARQFVEGDVQHWWLPASGKGVKTRVSDDRIWLPYVVAEYLEATEDFAVLDETVAFLGGGPLPPDGHEIFGAPQPDGAGSLFEHCVRALDSSLAVGAHGLPLFGTGDWNDGMNRVGAAGRGESVWLAWFLQAALLRFAPIAERRGDDAKAAAWREHASAVRQAVEREAWDGEWYRRGFFDDGTPLGSAASEECRIDAIAQSWAVISGAAEPGRAARAMAAVDSQLISRSDGLVKLFTPPFDRTHHDPGYIKAYPPGLRENGGQYSHAAMWTTLAFALLGDGDRAGEVFAILNPIHHSDTRAGVDRYKVEPYVVCADVYSSPQHVGRGGWTWYTGSAGWMYRIAAEGMLGIHRQGGVLRIDPCIPRAWRSFRFTYRFGSSSYRVTVENPHGRSRGIARATLDGRTIPHAPCAIVLLDDGRDHEGSITLG
jgi:cyclic beta-1,2-glucan synthetase